jgi:hypothetical protein
MNRNPWIGSLIATTAALQFLPARLALVDVRGLSPTILVVQAKRTAPAFAALEDVRDLPAEFIVQNEKVPNNETPDGKVTSVDAFANAPLVLAKIEVPKPAPAPAPVPAIRPVETTSYVDFEPSVRDGNGNWLPLPARKQNLIEYYSHMDFTTKTPTLAERAQPLIAQALVEAAGMSSHATAITPMGKLATTAPAATPAAPVQLPAPAAQPVQPATARFAAASVAPAEAVGLRGHLEMTGGLAFIGPETKLEVRHLIDGIARETGTVDIREGRFDIWVQDARGTLEAQLLAAGSDSDGRERLMGRAELDLSAIDYHHADELLLKLRPVKQSGVVQLVSAYSFNSHKVDIADSHVRIEGYDLPLAQNEDGDFIEPDLLPQSIFVARAEAKNYWGTLAVGMGRMPLEMQMYPSKMVHALLSLTAPDDTPERQPFAVIWGRVVDAHGRPLAGARVELAGDSHAIPVYFNNYFLPDHALHVTSENGSYAFVQVTPGIHSVRAQYAGRYIPAQTLPAESNFVSYVELQVGEIKNARVQIQDGFDASMILPSQVHVLGADLDLEIAGRGAIQYPSGQGAMTLEVDAGEDYELARFQLPRSQHRLHLPMVRRDWLETLAARRGVSVDPAQARMLGFVADGDFVIELRQDGAFAKAELIYFDGNGHATVSGVSGGGFVVLNATPGSLDLVVHFTGRKPVIYQTHYIEPTVLDIVALSAAARELTPAFAR